MKSGGGPPQSKTLARWPMTLEMREASWSAPVLWRFGPSAGKTGHGWKGGVGQRARVNGALRYRQPGDAPSPCRTNTQRRVFDFVRDKLVAGRPAPTAREVAAQFGWSSKRAAECHLEAIIRKGWLASEPGKARSLRLKDMAQAVRRAVVEIPLFGSIPAGFSANREQEADEC